MVTKVHFSGIVYFLMGLLIYFYLAKVESKLMVTEREGTEKKQFAKMYTCVYDALYKYYSGRKLIFLSIEIRDSFGEYLLRSGIHTTVDVSMTSVGTEYKNIFILQPNISHSTFLLYNKLISTEDKSSYYLILWPSKPLEYLKPYVSKIHQQFWTNRILSVASFIPTESGDYHVYTYFPYTDGNCGSGSEIQKIDECTSEGYKNNSNLFSGTEKLKNFHRCSVRCFGNHQYPESVLTRNKNGTLNVHGNIVYLLNTLQEHYNLTITIVDMFNQQYDWFFYNISNEMILDKYVNTPLEFGFGSFTILNDDKAAFEYSFFAANPECIGWAIPHYGGKYPLFWSAYVKEFPFLFWCFLGFAIFIATKLVILGNIIDRNKTGLLEISQNYLVIIFSFITPIPKIKSNLVSMNLFFFHWSVWGLVIRCAYEASLGSIMTVPIPIEQLKSHKDLLDYSFKVAGGVKMYELLQKASYNNTVLESLANKFEILPPSDGKDVLFNVYQNRNLAVLQPYRYTIYTSHKLAKSQGLNHLVLVMRPCLFQTYSTPLIVRKGSIMSEILYIFTQRLFESGLAKYWRLKDDSEKLIDIPPRRILNLYKIHGAFIIYFIGLVIAFSVLLAEIIYSKYTVVNKITKLQRKK